jgi:hypothetical protein
MTDSNQISNDEPGGISKSFLHGYSKQDLIVIIQTTLEKAKDRHQAARKWEAKCASLEAEVDALRASRRPS